MVIVKSPFVVIVTVDEDEGKDADAPSEYVEFFNAVA